MTTTARETEARIFQGGQVPFNLLSHDLGGFRELIRPGAFTKTLQEFRGPLPGLFRYSDGLRFGRDYVRVRFQVVQDQWKQHRNTGELRRELVEVRLICVSFSRGEEQVSRRARNIAEGVTRDFFAAMRQAPESKAA